MLKSDQTVARKLPLEDPQFLNYVRVGYAGVQLLTIALYLYTSSIVRPPISMLPIPQLSPKQIRKKNELAVLKYGRYILLSSPIISLIFLGVVEPSPPFVSKDLASSATH